MRPWQKINQLKDCFLKFFKTETKQSAHQQLCKAKFDEEQTWLGIG